MPLGVNQKEDLLKTPLTNIFGFTFKRIEDLKGIDWNRLKNGAVIFAKAKDDNFVALHCIFVAHGDEGENEWQSKTGPGMGQGNECEKLCRIKTLCFEH